MSRLTKKFRSGYGSVECFDSCKTCNGNQCEHVFEMINKLGEYEDFEDEGRLFNFSNQNR